ncbi:AAA family ATPase [Winogradskyella pacifica]|uniref:AAA family ATPase n=1 Tax=Winogradskyella pacifica TaxID=664642 RepID=UPI0015C976DD|nr:AAA family ATPase [Winogradskyella pacifica]
MKGFKLIALKTGAEKKRFITIPKSKNKIDPYKVLKQNTVYPFYSNFTFPSNNFNELDIDDKELIDLFSTTIDGHSLSVNINAIVGKNGSGKSSLIELLYLATYNIGCRLKLLRDPKTNRVLSPFKELELQLFYSIDNKFFLVNLLDGFVSKKEYVLKNNKLTIDAEEGKQFTVFDFKEYFYTITVNYSHYALNDLEVGRWVNSLFHKNDGYQTPIVLNPMRDNGNIDMLRENRLLKRRLQANLLQDIKDQDPKLSLRNIANGKIAKTIEIVYNSGKLQGYELEAQYNSEIRNKVVASIEDAFDFQISKQDLDSNLFTNICVNYICSKLLKIATYYRPYHKYFNEVDDKKFLRNINALIKDVRTSNSHIFFKVKGAILYLKYYDWLLGNIKDINSKKNELVIEDYAIKIQKIIDEETVFVNTYMLAPPSFFDTDIILEDGSSIDSLSSGEKQKVHSVSSIIYHIINLNSVSDYNRRIDPESRFHSYNYLNIVLDEIELYYHPEWQRTYIYDLLNSISRINHSNISFIKGLNITFLTHSPYILSDIPVSNVLKLDEGVPVSSLNAPQTYGANIYELLTDSFFLEHFYIGEYARREIQKLINTLQLDEKEVDGDILNEEEEVIRLRIEMIGEVFLKKKLMNMFYDKYPNSRNLRRIELERELKLLEEEDDSNK